ncbi:hypothetical protein CLOM_g13684 [Closterium sp. NIES-68]|nr:hypothetical protein CLOM_g13684 [Closterium sp. NIES-68]
MDSIPEFEEEIEMIGSEEEQRVALAMGGGGGVGRDGSGKGKQMSAADDAAYREASYGSQFDAEYDASESSPSTNGSDASGDATVGRSRYSRGDRHSSNRSSNSRSSSRRHGRREQQRSRRAGEISEIPIPEVYEEEGFSTENNEEIPPVGVLPSGVSPTGVPPVDVAPQGNSRMQQKTVWELRSGALPAAAAAASASAASAVAARVRAARGFPASGHNGARSATATTAAPASGSAAAGANPAGVTSGAAGAAASGPGGSDRHHTKAESAARGRGSTSSAAPAAAAAAAAAAATVSPTTSPPAAATSLPSPSPPLPPSPPFSTPLGPQTSPVSPTSWYAPLSPVLPGPPDGGSLPPSEVNSTPSSSPTDSTFSTVTSNNKPGASSPASSTASPPPASVASSAPGGGLCPGIDGGVCNFRMSSRTHFILMRFVSLFTVVSGLGYLSWKSYMVGRNITQAGPACLLFLSTEILVFLSSFMLVVELSKPAKERKALSMPPSGPFPRVAILICCCSEKIDVIQDTVKGAMSQNYPGERYTVWVLDDGGDDELKAWVEAEGMEGWSGGGGVASAQHQLQPPHQQQQQQQQQQQSPLDLMQQQQQLMVQQQQQGRRLFYLRRPKKKGVPHHFKAGNINYGLHFACGEFVAVLDADMIPSPFFLSALLPHIVGEEKGDVAFVQCPQSFYNIVKGDPLNDSSQDFYDVLLPYRDGRDSAQCVGTGVIFRSAHLQAIGGFTVGSITEDFDTAMTLHARGYKTAYVNQRLQAGLAPWSLEGYIKQHQRWATGSLQILLHRNPLLLRAPKFSLYRRISYWYAGVQYYLNVIVIMILVLPVLILALDLRIMPPGPIFETTRLYIILLVPYVFASRLLCLGLFSRLPNGMMVQLRGEQVWYWMSFFNCMAILRFFFPFISKKFEATGSTKKKAPAVWERLLTVWFHVGFCVAGVGAVAWRFATVDFHDCGMLLKVTSWAPFILFSVQSMLVPIMHVLVSPTHPKPEDRRKLLSYDEYGVPYLREDQLLPKRDYCVLLFNIIPAIWALTIGFYFYAAITNFRPGFCTKSGFFGYARF